MLTPRLKRYFGIPWVVAIFITSLHVAVMLVMSNQRIAWFGAALSVWSILIFFIYTGLSGKGRSPRHMVWPLIAAATGSVIALIHYELLPLIYSVVLGVCGILLYDHWYSRMPVPQNNKLQTGKLLPTFSVQADNGEIISSAQWLGRPLLLMFIRGNWCPLCVAQVKELAAEYQRLAAKNVRIVIVSAQPLHESRQLAKKFSVPFEFYADPKGEAAAEIGILHEKGSPLGLPRHSADTVIPTIVICDKQGAIQFVDVTGNYRDRPEPERIFQQLGSP